jgi:hypothetical protein
VFIPGWQADNDGVVELLHLMVFELHIQGPVRLGAASKNHQTAGDLIQAMNDPDAAILRFDQFNERARVFFPSAGDGGETGGFVHDKEGRVNIEDIHKLIVIEAGEERRGTSKE